MATFRYLRAAGTLLAAGLFGSLAAAAPSSLLVSATVSGLDSGDGPSITTDEQRPSRRLVSFDGRYVVFRSEATDLTRIPDANKAPDIFRRDLSTNNTELVSINQAGSATGNDQAHDPTISADGRFVCFLSSATDLAAGVDSHIDNVYVRDLLERKTVLVSASPAGVGGDAFSLDPVMTPNGRFVAFASLATNLVAGFAKGRHLDVFVRDLQAADPTRATEAVSLETSQPGSSGVGECEGTPAISADGRYVAFTTGTDSPYPFDNNRAGDVFVRDRGTKKTELLTVNRAGTGSANAASAEPVMTADGRYVAFISNATDMVAGPSVRAQNNVFVRDRTSRVTTLVSVNPAGTADGNGGSFSPAISKDGRYVAFLSSASDLAGGVTDTNGRSDLLVRDLQTRSTVPASVNQAGTAAGKGGPVGLPALSDDGRYVAFVSDSTDLVDNDTNGAALDVFRRDLIGKKTLLASVNTGGTSGSGASGRSPTHLSGDGSLVFFTSEASDLDPHDTNGSVQDVFASRPATAQPLLVTDGKVSPASLPVAGGKVTLSVHVTSPASITRAIATVSPPAGAAPVTVTLLHGAGSLYSGSYTAPANDGVKPRSYAVSFTANDSEGRQTNLAAAPFTVAGKAPGPAPTITNCVVTPAHLSYVGGNLTVSANIDAPNGVEAVLAIISGQPNTLLAHRSGTTYSGVAAIPKNPAAIPRTLSVAIHAHDQGGLLTILGCPGSIEDGPEPALITNCRVTPSRLPYLGGTLTISAEITSLYGIEAVLAHVSTGTISLLTHRSGNTYSGTAAIPKNPGADERPITVTIDVHDQAGLLTTAACPGSVQADNGNPVITNCTVTPLHLPAEGGKVTVSADIAAANPVVAVEAVFYYKGIKYSIASGLLSRGAGNSYSGSFLIGANRTEFDEQIRMTLSASTAAAQYRIIDCPDLIEQDSPYGAIGSITVSPTRLPWSGGSLRVTAKKVSAPAGIASVLASASSDDGRGPWQRKMGRLTRPRGAYRATVPIPRNSGRTARSITVLVEVTDSRGRRATRLWKFATQATRRRATR